MKRRSRLCKRAYRVVLDTCENERSQRRFRRARRGSSPESNETVHEKVQQAILLGVVGQHESLDVSYVLEESKGRSPVIHGGEEDPDLREGECQQVARPREPSDVPRNSAGRPPSCTCSLTRNLGTLFEGVRNKVSSKLQLDERTATETRLTTASEDVVDYSSLGR